MLGELLFFKFKKYHQNRATPHLYRTAMNLRKFKNEVLCSNLTEHNIMLN